MVVSVIDPTLTYAEIRTVNLNDTKMESELYQIMLLGINVIIAVGQSKHTNKNISYFPIYLVKPDDSVIQIGVYEFLTNALSKYIGANSKLVVSSKMIPLLYSFVTPELLYKMRKVPDVKISPDAPVSFPKQTMRSVVKIPPRHADIFLSGGVSHRPLPEESRTDAIDMRQKYHVSDKDSWVNKFMRNKNYLLDETEGSDKCFFTAIKDAFSSIGFQTSVDKLRHKLAINISKDVFFKYKHFYDALSELDVKNKTYLKQLQTRNNELKQLITKTIDRTTQQNIIREGENNLVLFNKLKNEKKIVDRYFHEYRFMKGVNTLSDFQKKIKTCSFWAETWAISEVERILNVKFVILMQAEYLQMDINNVLQCGYKHNGLFQPDYYIILSRSKADYQLVSYKGRRIMKYIELPYDVKRLISDKCMEYENTGFTNIPQFMKPIQDTSEVVFDNKLYDDNVVLVVYEHSANNLPGYGNGEYVPEKAIAEYAELSSDPKWRNKLANEWVQPFELDGLKWLSAEHYYQGAKFKKHHPHFYKQFAVSSGMEIGNNVDMAKSAGRKTGKYKGIQYREPSVVRDGGFDKDEAMYTALMAKFSQNPDLKETLLNTRNAKIMIHRKGMPSTVAKSLMKVRKQLGGGI